MRRTPLIVRALVIGALLALPNEESRAQVGLQVRNGNLWGAVVDLSASGPVSLRWKWDGAGTPSKVVWQLATTSSTSTSTSRESDPVAQEGAMSLPAATGVYYPFTVTPPASLRLPLYIRVRVENAGKSAYSRWITVRAPTSTTTATSGTSAPPAPAVDASQPVRVILTGIEAIRTASVGYENAPLTTNATQTVKTDLVYTIAVVVEFNWADFANSSLAVKSTPVIGLTAGQKFGLKFQVWPPHEQAKPMQNAKDVVMMVALMHRYRSPAISTLEAAIRSEMTNALKASAPSAKSNVVNSLRGMMLSAFRRGLQKATERPRSDHPVEMDDQGWAELVGGPTAAIEEELQNARIGIVFPHPLKIGSDTNKGGQFILHLGFHPGT